MVAGGVVTHASHTSHAAGVRAANRRVGSNLVICISTCIHTQYSYLYLCTLTKYSLSAFFSVSTVLSVAMTLLKENSAEKNEGKIKYTALAFIEISQIEN